MANRLMLPTRLCSTFRHYTVNKSTIPKISQNSSLSLQNCFSAKTTQPCHNFTLFSNQYSKVDDFQHTSTSNLDTQSNVSSPSTTDSGNENINMEPQSNEVKDTMSLKAEAGPVLEEESSIQGHTRETFTAVEESESISIENSVEIDGKHLEDVKQLGSNVEEETKQLLNNSTVSAETFQHIAATVGDSEQAKLEDINQVMEDTPSSLLQTELDKPLLDNEEVTFDKNENTVPYEINVESNESQMGSTAEIEAEDVSVTEPKDHSKDENTYNFEEQTSSSEQESNTHQNEKDISEIKLEILENALDFVPTNGWSRKSLSCGAEVAGYAGVSEGMFTNGGNDLLIYFIKTSNVELKEYLQEQSKLYVDSEEKISTKSFLRDAIEFRLRKIIPYIDVWPEALSMLLSPSLVVSSSRYVGEMVDDIWFYAGDKSADFNWYTKRAILAKIYGSTQLAMLNDDSPDFIDTWAFLDRQFDAISDMSKVARDVQGSAQLLQEIGEAGFTQLRNIVGLGEKRR